MPRYFFNLHDGRTVIDHEGMELEGLVACGREALQRFDRFLATDLTLLSTYDAWRLEVIDSNGGIVLTLDLSVKPIAGVEVPAMD